MTESEKAIHSSGEIMQKLDSHERRLLAIERKPTFMLTDVRLVKKPVYVIVAVSIVLMGAADLAEYFGAPRVVFSVVPYGLLLLSIWKIKNSIVKKVAVGIPQPLDIEATVTREVIKAKKNTDD